jgi:hypothetical protein
MTPAQLHAARGLLNRSRRELNAASGVSVDTLNNIETGKFIPQETTAEKLLITLAAHGVELIGSRYVQGVVMVLKDKIAVAERMATMVVEIMTGEGSCLPKDLLARGFTKEEIHRHWAMAKALSQLEPNTIDSQSTKSMKRSAYAESREEYSTPNPDASRSVFDDDAVVMQSSPDLLRDRNLSAYHGQFRDHCRYPQFKGGQREGRRRSDHTGSQPLREASRVDRSDGGCN